MWINPYRDLFTDIMSSIRGSVATPSRSAVVVWCVTLCDAPTPRDQSKCQESPSVRFRSDSVPKRNLTKKNRDLMSRFIHLGDRLDHRKGLQRNCAVGRLGGEEIFCRGLIMATFHRTDRALSSIGASCIDVTTKTLRGALARIVPGLMVCSLATLSPRPHTAADTTPVYHTLLTYHHAIRP